MERLLAQMPRATVHADLGAFADFIIERDRRRKLAEH
jgi:hypothetical protein